MKKSIVMIGKPGGVPGSGTSSPAGSGALIRDKRMFFVVTAKHVLTNINDPIIMFNDLYGRIKGYRTSYLSKEFDFEWKHHADKEIDLSVLRVGLEQGEDDIKFITADMFIEFDQIDDGEDVFFMGFPLGLTNLSTLTPAIRQGCVSLKLYSDTIIRGIRYAPKTILLDGQISGGNSGSPVFRKPTIARNRASLFGIVTSHIESIIKDLSPKPKPIARENSGLGIVSATDHIVDLLDEY